MDRARYVAIQPRVLVTASSEKRVRVVDAAAAVILKATIVLRGLSFDEASKRKDAITRDVQFTVPPDSADILQELPGFADFDALNEVLRMLRCGFGLKDAPAAWGPRLDQRMASDQQMRGTHVDRRVYIAHDGKQVGSVAGSHVDDIKMAAPEQRPYEISKKLEKDSGSLKVQG